MPETRLTSPEVLYFKSTGTTLNSLRDFYSSYITIISQAPNLPKHQFKKCVSIVSLDNQKKLILFVYFELTLPGVPHGKIETLHLHLAYELHSQLRKQRSRIPTLTMLAI